jgi:hypothetical protein
MVPMALTLLTALLGQIPPFSARFEQVTVTNNKTDTARGTIYFAAPWRTYYQVDYPLNQRLSVVMNTMTVYYPDETLAYVIKTKSQVETPMSQQSLGAIDPSQAMSKLGFKRGKASTVGDTAYEVWNPKDKRMPSGRVTFGRIGRVTVFVEALRQNGQPMMRTRLSGYVLVDTFTLPTRVVTERFDVDGSRVTETLTYSALSTATDFLSTLGRFALPPKTRIKNANW